MILKCIIFFIVTVFLVIIEASITKDLILGRTYVIPAETPTQTFNLLRQLDSGITVQQILYAIFTPIQAIINAILTLICSVIKPITTVVEALRGAILVNLISILEVINSVVSILAPQVGLVLQVLQIVLNAGNELLYNGSTILQDYGCSTILSINDVISSIVNAIIGVF